VALSVALTPSGLDTDALADRAVLMVDVLRASTSIATALANGARAVIPVADKGEAGRLAASLGRDAVVLAGERGGETLPGFPLGNSPASFTVEAVSGKTVVLTTTNGTAVLVRAQAATRLAVGGFVNAGAAVGFLQRALDDGLAATIVCAGWQGQVSLEDALCAGYLADRLGVRPEGDGGRIAQGLYLGVRANLGRALRQSDHARRLVSLGSEADIAACAEIDTLVVLPVFRDNRLVAA